LKGHSAVVFCRCAGQLSVSCLHRARLLAGVVQSYVDEEWLHYALHYSSSSFPSFGDEEISPVPPQSPRDRQGYGITTRFWDGVFDTRFPQSVRRSLSKN